MNKAELNLLLNNIENIKSFLITLQKKQLDEKSVEFWVKANIGNTNQIIEFLKNKIGGLK